MKHKSEDYKLSAVEYYLIEDNTQEEVCKIFKCSPRSLMRWVEKYNTDGEIKRYNKKPVAYKITKDQVKYALKELDKNKTITMDDLLSKNNYRSFFLNNMYINNFLIKDSPVHFLERLFGCIKTTNSLKYKIIKENNLKYNFDTNLYRLLNNDPNYDNSIENINNIKKLLK
jgi:transposase